MDATIYALTLGLGLVMLLIGCNKQPNVQERKHDPEISYDNKFEIVHEDKILPEDKQNPSVVVIPRDEYERLLRVEQTLHQFVIWFGQQVEKNPERFGLSPTPTP